MKKDFLESITEAVDDFLPVAERELLLEIDINRIRRKLEPATSCDLLEAIIVGLQLPIGIFANLVCPARQHIAAT